MNFKDQTYNNIKRKFELAELKRNRQLCEKKIEK